MQENWWCDRYRGPGVAIAALAAWKNFANLNPRTLSKHVVSGARKLMVQPLSRSWSLNRGPCALKNVRDRDAQVDFYIPRKQLEAGDRGPSTGFRCSSSLNKLASAFSQNLIQISTKSNPNTLHFRYNSNKYIEQLSITPNRFQKLFFRFWFSNSSPKFNNVLQLNFQFSDLIWLICNNNWFTYFLQKNLNSN